MYSTLEYCGLPSLVCWDLYVATEHSYELRKEFESSSIRNFVIRYINTCMRCTYIASYGYFPNLSCHWVRLPTPLFDVAIYIVLDIYK